MLRCRSGGRDDRGPPPAEANQGNNLHVSGLAKSVDVPMLEEAFGKIGKVSFSILLIWIKLMNRSTKSKSCRILTPVHQPLNSVIETDKQRRAEVSDS